MSSSHNNTTHESLFLQQRNAHHTQHGNTNNNRLYRKKFNINEFVRILADGEAGAAMKRGQLWPNTLQVKVIRGRELLPMDRRVCVRFPIGLSDVASSKATLSSLCGHSRYTKGTHSKLLYNFVCFLGYS